MPIPLVLLLALALHGGRYLPPHPEPGDEPEPDPTAPVLQPGFGPTASVVPDRWEWWFDLNREQLVDRRRLMAERAPPPGQPALEPVGDDLRRTVVLPVLLELLGHHNRDVRASAAVAVARLGTTSALPAVEEATRDPDLFVRTQAVLALGMAPSGAPTERLTALLRGRTVDGEIRAFAAVALGLIGSRESLDVLRGLLAPERLARLDNQLRAGVVFAAGVTGDDALLPELVALHRSKLVKGDGRLRAVLAVALGRTGGAEAVPPLLDLVVDADNQVRRSAASGLEAVAPLLGGSLVPLVARARVESDLAARANLYRVLGLAGDHVESRAFLVAELERATTLVRPHVALALGSVGGAEAVAALRARLDGESELSARASLLTALALAGDPDLLPILRDELESAREPVYVASLCRAAGLLGEPDEELRAMLLDRAETVHDVEVTRLAVLGLGLLGDRLAVRELADTLPEVGSTVDRAARAYALGQAGDATTIDALVRAATDERQPSYVIAYAVTALGELCDPRPRSPAWRLSRHAELHDDLSQLVELYRLP